MLNMADVVNDPDFAQPFTILRTSGGSWSAGQFQVEEVAIDSYGVISVATARDLQQVPEADRVAGTMVFHSSQPIFETSEDRGGTSDILLWRGEQYRVSNIFPYVDYGYWKAFALRMKGS